MNFFFYGSSHLSFCFMKFPSMKRNNKFVSTSLYVYPIITHKTYDQFASNFDWVTCQNHGHILSLDKKYLDISAELGSKDITLQRTTNGTKSAYLADDWFLTCATNALLGSFYSLFIHILLNKELCLPRHSFQHVHFCIVFGSLLGRFFANIYCQGPNLCK